MTGVKFHPDHVWKVLGRILWIVQKLARQAEEHADDEVAYRKKDAHHLSAARENAGPEAARKSLEQNFGSRRSAIPPGR